MSIIDQITDALTPHARALGVTATHHANRITGELSEIRKGVSDLNRPDTGDHWQRFSATNLAQQGTFELSPELRVPLNEMFLVQNITLNNQKQLTVQMALVNDSGQVIWAISDIGGFALQRTEVLAGALAFMPGEHISIVTSQGNLQGVSLQVIRMTAPKTPLTTQARDRKTEMYTPGGGGQANIHDINRDLIATTGIYTEEASVVTPTEGEQVSTDMRGHDPAAVAQRAIYVTSPDPTSV